MKKQVLLFCLTCFIPISMLLAQPGTSCTGYPHLLNITGFYGPCSDDGKICFDYLGGVWDGDDDCEDLVVEISFPSSNFTVIDDGNFVTTTSGGTTKLTLHPVSYSGGTWSECIEGTLNVPGTNFTKKIYYATHPGTTFQTNSFKVDNVIAVGTAMTTTDLNTLTGGVLPISGDMTPKRIAVEGTLNIDENYHFTTSFNNSNSRYSELIMMPGSKITVEDGTALFTSLTNIHGCESTKWEGIELLQGTPLGGSLKMGVRTTLSDAEVGVEMDANSVFDMTDSEISRCNIGMGSFGATQRSITFLGVNNPAANLINYFTACHEGIHLENVTSKLDLTMTSGLPYMYFENIKDYAIYLEATDLEAKDLNIYNCGHGVWVEKPNKQVILNGGYFVGKGGKGVGVYTRGTHELRLKKCVFNNWSTGLTRRTNAANEYTQVENVNMSQCVYDIWGTVLQSKADIQFNDLNAVSHNVWLSGIPGLHQWNINSNNAMRSGTTAPDNMVGVDLVNRNIFFNNVAKGVISYNETNFTSPLTNIYISGGYQNRVNNNVLAAPSSEDMNLKIMTSSSASIYCNDMGGASTAMTVLNNCDYSFIDRNDFSGATGDFNLVYGSAANTFAQTGKQSLGGNIFDASSSMAPVAKNFEPCHFMLHRASTKLANITPREIHLPRISRGHPHTITHILRRAALSGLRN